MSEKKQLIGSLYDLDEGDHVTDENQEKALADKISEERLISRKLWSLLLLTGSIGIILFISTLMLMRLHPLKFQDDLIKFRTSFKGGSGHLVEQNSIASGINNIIEYYVTVSPEEQVIIVDDFNREIQIMKVSGPSGEFCYVSELKKGEFVRPSDVVFGSKFKTEKGYVSQVYETYDNPIHDLTALGDRGAALCTGVPVEWIRSINETETPITEFNITTSALSSSRLRSKRNIRQCHTSCCWLVCCCDVHHFTWERAEHFTCNHVCRGCTSRYKSVIRKLCNS